ncbi:hypothetical protein [Ottowia thiooxydans]|uniref:Small secreted protein n=1 Tax=Ottowia thiooxydans TaxID=219182 RepID=A0ABV2QCR2_9BURK
MKRFYLLICAAALGALALAGCVTTGAGAGGSSGTSSGSGITVYGTMDAGITR